MSLPEFLLARIAEREALAVRMRDAVWPEQIMVCPADDTGNSGLPPCVSVTDPLYRKAWVRLWKTGNYEIGWTLSDDNTEAWGPTLARREIAECEAKRRIVEWATTVYAIQTGGPRPRQGPNPILALLALPYADHPDYQPEWRP
jgi:hypothetical protein